MLVEGPRDAVGPTLDSPAQQRGKCLRQSHAPRFLCPAGRQRLVAALGQAVGDDRVRDLQLEAGLEGRIDPAVQRGLRQRGGHPRLTRQSSRPLHGRAHQFAGRHDTIDQAEPQRLLRVDRLTQQQQFLRFDRTDEQRQQLRQPAGDAQPETDLREPEARALGRDDEVTSQREFRAGTDCVPVHRGDHRDGKTADSPGDVLQVLETA